MSTLYIVATPIGNLDDLSPRAVKVLAGVDLVVAEDTRHSGRLLQHLGLHKAMLALHDYNERQRLDAVLARLAEGQSVALISDAGTPLISDPGYLLVSEARKQGFRVSPIPGCCALIAALSAAGLATDRFSFHGFLPTKRKARQAALEALRQDISTLVFYEAPHRILETADALIEVFGASRDVVFARELTKAFESFYTGTAEAVRAQLADDPYAEKGEYVVMVAGAPRDTEVGTPAVDADRLLALLLPELPVKKAARIVADATGLGRNELYQRALALKQG
ncbi:MAG: 16S rRNA (cytidine(1402)-2'-O)-methyltransferase [Marinobacter sp.]|nr:16S rRNA (cytidine(1402)-2'-O)-methyltransferase [Marinobacter sp.]